MTDELFLLPKINYLGTDLIFNPKKETVISNPRLPRKIIATKNNLFWNKRKIISSVFL